MYTHIQKVKEKNIYLIYLYLLKFTQVMHLFIDVLLKFLCIHVCKDNQVKMAHHSRIFTEQYMIQNASCKRIKQFLVKFAN